MNIETRKNRSTKTMVERYERENTCLDHGGVCEFDSIRQAREFMSVPQEWCDDCRAVFYHGAIIESTYPN